MRQLGVLARSITGTPREVLARLLVLACEQTGLDAAFASLIDDEGQRVVRVAVRADGETLGEAVGLSEPLPETWCGQVFERGELLVRDVADEPRLAALPVTAIFDIASYAGVLLRDGNGKVVGTLCALGHTTRDDLNRRDLETLDTIGVVVTPLLLGLDRPNIPTPRRSPELTELAAAVSDARSTEDISRHIIDALHDLTGLGSTYLTVIHDDADMQEVRYSRNTRDGFEIPEGLHVPWGDTLCKRALDEGRPCTVDVQEVWGDSEAAAALGIQVYVSVPVTLSDGEVWGTLCGADNEQAEDLESHLTTMRLFARLIAAQVERDQIVDEERSKTVQAQIEASTDPLTGCQNRRVVEPWLTANLDDLRDDETVLVAFVDVDDFKVVNDGLGHAAGDAVLAAIGARLRGAARPQDLVARFGGDEFLVAARMPQVAVAGFAFRLEHAASLEVEWEGRSIPVHLSIGITSADAHDAESLIADADQAMYAVKRTKHSRL